MWAVLGVEEQNTENIDVDDNVFVLLDANNTDSNGNVITPIPIRIVVTKVHNNICYKDKMAVTISINGLVP